MVGEQNSNRMLLHLVAPGLAPGPGLDLIAALGSCLGGGIAPALVLVSIASGSNFLICSQDHLHAAMQVIC